MNMHPVNNSTQVKQATINKLIISIVCDLIGMLSYLFPGFAETIDFIWAPLSGVLLKKMYGGHLGTIAGMFSFIEEILPFTDVIPTFTLTWLYLKNKESK